MKSSQPRCSTVALTVQIAVAAIVGLTLQSVAHAQSPPPDVKECTELIKRASDDALRKKMTKEELDRTTACLNLLKNNPRPNGSRVSTKIFRN